MAREHDQSSVSTLTGPGGSLAEQAAADRRGQAWWRLRTWRRDLDALTRLRDGLQAMDLAEIDEVATADPGGPADPAGPPAQAEEVRSRADELALGVSETVPQQAVPHQAVPHQTVPHQTVPHQAVPHQAVPHQAVPHQAVPDATGPDATGSDATGLAPADAQSEEPGSARAQSAATPPAAGPDPGIVAIRDTFRYVADAGDEAVAYFYAWLFLRQPELRVLFPPAMDEQRDRLFRALGRIVESLSTPDEMAAYLGQLGRDHRKYGVEPAMYSAVGEALIATLKAYAGTAFTPEAEEIWTQTYTAASALMIRAAEDDAALAPACWTGEIVHIEQRGRGIAVVTLAPDRVLPYLAGQHLTLQTSRWPHVWRPYSIACMPRDDGLLSLHVKAVPGGWVSGTLVHHSTPGDEVVLGPARGTMTLAPAAGRDLLCVAGGTGLAPIKAIIEQVVRDSAARPRQTYLFYGARNRDELYDMRDLWRLADAYPGLQITPVTSDDPAFDGMQGNVGRVAARYMPHQDCEAYVAGPADMVRETNRVLTRAGLASERIHFDDVLLAGRTRVGSGM